MDVYATGEPQEAFHKRIAFCLKMHNDSVMGLRFPPNAFRKYLQTAEVKPDKGQQIEGLGCVCGLGTAMRGNVVWCKRCVGGKEEKVVCVWGVSACG